MNKVMYKFYQEMSQMSIVRKSDDHETFERMDDFESFFEELEIESLKKNPKWSYMFED